LESGYFVTTPGFILSQFKICPKLYGELSKIKDAIDTDNFYKTVERFIPRLKNKFDNQFGKINPKDVFVIAADLGWSDVGAWEALKEALEKESNENVTKGKFSSRLFG